MSDLHKVRIITDGPSGIVTKTFIDDRQVHGITELYIGVTEPNVVVVTLFAADMEVDAEAEVAYRAAAFDEDGVLIYGVGPTRADAFTALGEGLKNGGEEDGFIRDAQG